MEEYYINTADEMLSLGRKLALRMQAGCVVALIGDLGAGKTHLSKGICAEMGCGETSSPTFSIVNELTGQSAEVFHFDFYRLKQVEELWSLGWNEYLEREGIVIVEWANLFPEVFPHETMWIKIVHEGDGRRVFIKEQEDGLGV